MMSLLWFYRPEHTDIGRQEEDCAEEVFASKHRDHTSVACIEDKCFVMTFNEYCRCISQHSKDMGQFGIGSLYRIIFSQKDR